MTIYLFWIKSKYNRTLNAITSLKPWMKSFEISNTCSTKNDGCQKAAIVFIGRTRTEGPNRRSSRVQWEFAHIAEALGGKAAEGGLVRPPLRQ